MPTHRSSRSPSPASNIERAVPTSPARTAPAPCSWHTASGSWRHCCSPGTLLTTATASYSPCASWLAHQDLRAELERVSLASATHQLQIEDSEIPLSSPIVNFITEALSMWINRVTLRICCTPRPLPQRWHRDVTLFTFTCIACSLGWDDDDAQVRTGTERNTSILEFYM